MRTLTYILFNFLFISTAYAACTAPPVAVPEDTIVQFKSVAGQAGVGPTNVIANNIEGAVIFNDTTKKLEVCDGTDWVNVSNYYTGSDEQIIFNDGGSQLTGVSNMTWDNSAQIFRIDGDINYTGTITDVSDERLKGNKRLISGSLDKILKTKPYSYEMKNDELNKVEFGLMAQDLEKIYPELVITNKDGFKSVNYIGLIAPIIDAIKIQNLIIESQRLELEEVKQRVSDLEAVQNAQ